MTATDIKPCPFCGGEAETITGPIPRRWGVRCKNCDAWRDDRCQTEAEAITAWNTRPTPLAEALAVPEVAALVQALESIERETQNVTPELMNQQMALHSAASVARAALRAIGEGRADG